MEGTPRASLRRASRVLRLRRSWGWPRLLECREVSGARASASDPKAGRPAAMPAIEDEEHEVSGDSETSGGRSGAARLRAEGADGPEEGPSISAADRRLVTIAMMLAMSVAALEQLVVATAMPRIIASLGGGQHYAWVMSAYLMAATVSTPIYGKLADIFGRRRVLMFGLSVFLLGSVLSGLANSMTMLIAMRGLQGLGAGAVMPMVLTIIGDIFTLSERAKVQSLFSGVWGSASVLGPVLGGFLTDNFSWRWVFFVPLPFGAVALAVIAFRYREVLRSRGGRRLDWPGAALLAAGSSTLLLAILEGTGHLNAQAIWLGLATVVLFGIFVRWERQAADPILPLDLFASPMILAAMLGNFLLGALLFGLDTYIPLEFQGVLGRSATQAGGLMTPLFTAWSFSVTVAAKVVIRRGFRASAIAGTALILVGLGTIVAGSAFPEVRRLALLGGDGRAGTRDGAGVVELHPLGAERRALGAAGGGDRGLDVLPVDRLGAGGGASRGRAARGPRRTESGGGRPDGLDPRRVAGKARPRPCRGDPRFARVRAPRPLRPDVRRIGARAPLRGPTPLEGDGPGRRK